MATISPSPFPESGQRKLSAREAMQRAKAAACTVQQDNKPSCSGQVFVGLFFDGTGNNLFADYEERPVEERKHSNVVRLFHTFRTEQKKGYFRHYIPGVGTKFPKIGDDNTYLFGKNRGAIGGERGENRIIWGLLQLVNSPHQYVTGGALLIQDPEAKIIANTLASSGSPAAQRRMALRTWQDKLAAALKGRKPAVEQINVSVFGFSRGAAEARVFVNWLFEVCKQEGGGWTFAGIPIRLQFLGIFDTVASVGLANLSDSGTLAGHQGWADNTLEINPAVERCVHFVAGHEVRACFPLDSVRVKSDYPANAMEVMYPGAHSDVGGGYAPKDLGVSPAPDAFMSIIPGKRMYEEAIDAGVPLKDWKYQLEDRFRNDLTPSDTAIADFNAYIKTARIGSGPVEELGRKHMAHYFSYRFKHRNAFFQRPPYTTASAKDQGYLRSTQNCFVKRLSSLTPAFEPGKPRSARDQVALSPDFDPVKSAELHEKMLKAAGLPSSFSDQHAIRVAKRIDTRSVTPEMEVFFDRYIHDSMAGFIDMGMDEYENNSIGILKFRTVFKGND
jgi:hypothetical protein